MFHRVIVGVDGGPEGRDAVALATQLLDSDGGLTLAHVHGGDFYSSRVSNPSYDAVERDASSALLEREHRETNVDATVMSIGAPSVGSGLHVLAEEVNADLLVVGSCRRGPLSRVMLGNDTRAALNGAPCAVALAPRGYAAEATPFSVIGVAYDESSESRAALASAQALAERNHAKVRLRLVIPFATYVPMSPLGVMIPFSTDRTIRETQQRMSGLRGVESEVLHGLPGEELAAFGATVDLLVVGSRGYGPLGRLIHGSTSNYLMRHARCPLLVLPRTAASKSVGAARAEAREPVLSS